MQFPSRYPTDADRAAFDKGFLAGHSNHACSKGVIVSAWKDDATRDSFALGFDAGQWQPALVPSPRAHEEMFFDPQLTPMLPGEVMLG